MTIDKQLIDQLLTDYQKPEDIIGENGLLKEPAKAILERALEAEMTEHLGYEKHDPAGHHRGNTRNGKNSKTLKGDFGELELETPRDRQARFDLQTPVGRSVDFPDSLMTRKDRLCRTEASRLPSFSCSLWLHRRRALLKNATSPFTTHSP